MGVSGQRAYAAGQQAALAPNNMMAMQAQQQPLAMQSMQYLSQMDCGTGYNASTIGGTNTYVPTTQGGGSVSYP